MRKFAVAHLQTATRDEERLLGLLSCRSGAQRRLQERREGHRAALVRLRCSTHQRSAHVGQSFLHVDAPTGKVDRRDLQRSHLSPPEPGVGEEGNEIRVSIALPCERRHLFMGKVPTIGRALPRHLHAIGGVAIYPTIPHGVLHEGRENEVDLAHSLAHLQALPDRLALVLNAIADADDGAILFHCSAGWDRTGLVAAVLLRAVDVTDDAAVADYLKSFTNADAMAALHERSIEVEERQQILGRLGHTAESAFRDMYGNLDLEAWFSESCIAPETRVAIETWRGAAASLRPV